MNKYLCISLYMMFMIFLHKILYKVSFMYINIYSDEGKNITKGMNI